MTPTDPKHDEAAAAATEEPAYWTPRKQDGGTTIGWECGPAPGVSPAPSTGEPKEADPKWLHPGYPTDPTSETP
jgi:hypothetical protein